jgi:NAD-dependent dihydropyrimidine dehydrogenase PreA subunit
MPYAIHHLREAYHPTGDGGFLNAQWYECSDCGAFIANTHPDFCVKCQKHMEQLPINATN